MIDQQFYDFRRIYSLDIQRMHQLTKQESQSSKFETIKKELLNTPQKNQHTSCSSPQKRLNPSCLPRTDSRQDQFSNKRETKTKINEQEYFYEREKKQQTKKQENFNEGETKQQTKKQEYFNERETNQKKNKQEYFNERETNQKKNQQFYPYGAKCLACNQIYFQPEDNHKQFVCSQSLVECESCKQKVKRRNIEKHFQCCAYVKCPQCQIPIYYKAHNHHLKVCWSKRIFPIIAKKEHAIVNQKRQVPFYEMESSHISEGSSRKEQPQDKIIYTEKQKQKPQNNLIHSKEKQSPLRNSVDFKKCLTFNSNIKMRTPNTANMNVYTPYQISRAHYC